MLGGAQGAEDRGVWSGVPLQWGSCLGVVKASLTPSIGRPTPLDETIDQLLRR